MSLCTRNETHIVNVGGLKIGGGNPVIVQSMTNTDTRDADATVAQIHELERAGCELVRVAVPDMDAAYKLAEIKERISIPLVADIHFDYRIALEAIRQRVDKLRINPGNIGRADRTRAVVDAAQQAGIPIRIGVNSGSLSKAILQKYGQVTSEAIVESAMEHVRILEECHFTQIIISAKVSGAPLTIEVYRRLAEMVKYPLHVGVTEAGLPKAGAIRSAVGIGSVLALGIGDTIRVSLTGDPVEEIFAAKEILASSGLRRFGINFVSCPTCGRTETGLIPIAEMLTKKCEGLDKNITVAIMGCAVNGPGEAREADLGVACGKNCGLIFKNGATIKKVAESEIVGALYEEIINF